MTTLILAFLLSTAPAITTPAPAWAFVVPDRSSDEPSPPVDDFLTELDGALFSSVTPFDEDEPADPFESPEPCRDDVIEAAAAADMAVMQTMLAAMGWW